MIDNYPVASRLIKDQGLPGAALLLVAGIIYGLPADGIASRLVRDEECGE
jgi:hypothetical protein